MKGEKLREVQAVLAIYAIYAPSLMVPKNSFGICTTLRWDNKKRLIQKRKEEHQSILCSMLSSFFHINMTVAAQTPSGGGKFELFGRYLFIDLLDTHSSKHTCFLSFFLQLHNLKLNFTPHNMYKCTVDRLIGLTTLNRDFVKLKLNRYICVCASDMILGESNFMV